MGNIFDMLANSAQRLAEERETLDKIEQYNAQKDAAIFQTAEESKKQNMLLSEQVETLKEQNKMLKELYESAKAEADNNKRESRHNKIFGWVSFAVGTVIGLAGVLVGIFV